MLQFLSLGSGSSGNAYLLWTEKNALLIDAGLGIRLLKRYFQSLELSFEMLNAVLITHDHADHIKSVSKLSNIYQIPVYTTEAVFSGISRNYSVSPKMDAQVKNAIEVDVPFHIGDFTITAFPVPHDSTDCVGYHIEIGGIVFTILTDVGHVTERIQQEVGLANYLVLESNHDREMLQAGPYPAYLKGRISGKYGHLSNHEAGELLANYATTDLKRVWLCHLSEENNHPELARKTISSILRKYGIIEGQDFEVEILKRRVPSGSYLIPLQCAICSSNSDMGPSSNGGSPGSGL